MTERGSLLAWPFAFVRWFTKRFIAKRFAGRNISMARTRRALPVISRCPCEPAIPISATGKLLPAGFCSFRDEEVNWLVVAAGGQCVNFHPAGASGIAAGRSREMTRRAWQINGAAPWCSP